MTTKKKAKKRGQYYAPSYMPNGLNSIERDEALRVVADAIKSYTDNGIDLYSKNEWVGMYVYVHVKNGLPKRIERILNAFEKRKAIKKGVGR